MGIKPFTKVFNHLGEIKYKDLKGKNIVIDASVEIYRAALGMKIGEQLKNSFGVPTSHINTILLGVILKLKSANANQYWVFDHNQKIDDGEVFHNPLKQLELKKRRDRRETASKNLANLQEKYDKLTVTKKKSSSDLDDSSDLSDFSDVDEIEQYHSNSKVDIISPDLHKSNKNSDKIETEKILDLKKDIQKQEKMAFKLESFYVEDVIFMLNSLDIPWVECPAGFESEQICAISTNKKDIFGVKMDYVLSVDADALIFGAKKWIKRDIKKKKFFLYDLNTVLQEHNLSYDDLVKIAVILGCDFAPKTPRVAEKTVLKKYKDVKLTDAQNNAVQLFKKHLTPDVKINVNNLDNNSFSDENKYKQLLDWLELVKNYNRDRIKKQFHKQSLFKNIV